MIQESGAALPVIDSSITEPPGQTARPRRAMVSASKRERKARTIMSEPSKAQAARDERLRIALRENLRRRKAQARTREQASRPELEKAENDKNDN